ncbi:ABC1 kinase family protein [Epilithonimonas vandammei]|uniref:ABC1 kinase family protein n=1 Tax=Epilithonimonas vandammei TaxID=2487072 RepID=UPI00289CEE0E|nr:AarF/UbiB family protein [Epilithonimonas vandammei]
MFDKQQRKLKRSARLVSVLSKYGFQDLISRLNTSKKDDEQLGISADAGLYQRIRLALEELGPSFVKFGQGFSNREDLLPPDLIAELQKLQDKVETVPMDIESVVATEFDITPSDFFLDINPQPIATASIAQVYTARLLTGEKVILKIKKPNVQAVIEDDLLLIKDLVKLIDNYSEWGKKLNLKQVVSTFEKSLLEEVSLINEKNNIHQFAINFKDNTDTHVPKVYDDFSNNNVLCMEFIEGFKITDVAALKEKNLDPVQLSEKGLKLFATQILEYGFFHADPHAGNILVQNDGKVVFIDFGAVGKIQPNDKEILENMIVGFVAKNPNRIIRNLKKMAISYDIPDDKQFEKDVSEVLEFVHSTSLQDINTQEIMNKMKDVIANNHINMPGYFYLLFKGIGLIEGVGRTINPDLDIVKTLSPYTKTIIAQRFSPRNLLKNNLSRILDFTDNLDEIPKELKSLLEKLDGNKFTVTSEIRNIDKTNQLLNRGLTNVVIAIVLAALIMASAVFLSLREPETLEIASSSFIIGLLSAVLLYRLLKKS